MASRHHLVIIHYWRYLKKFNFKLKLSQTSSQNKYLKFSQIMFDHSNPKHFWFELLQIRGSPLDKSSIRTLWNWMPNWQSTTDLPLSLTLYRYKKNCRDCVLFDFKELISLVQHNLFKKAYIDYMLLSWIIKKKLKPFITTNLCLSQQVIHFNANLLQYKRDTQKITCNCNLSN